MPSDLIPSDEVAERSAGSKTAAAAVLHTNSDNQSVSSASGGEPKTGSAPPFRARLGTLVSAPSVKLAVAPEPTWQTVNRSPHQATRLDFPIVSGYEIGAELGRGGMGVVYQARQCSLNRWVALKMILAGPYADSTARQRFHTEAEAVARLQHPNIVQIHEVGECDGRPFLSLEYVAGGSLFSRVAGTPQSEQKAARLAETLAQATHYMHQRGILHRDLKPNNVLLTADGMPKITDFGLAKILDVDTGPTRTMMLLGTPSYMAPEQAAGDPKQVGTPADVYSLGAILYELLTGRAPFQGVSPLDTLEQVRNQTPVPPRRLQRSVSGDLETICLKCLEKEPSKRYHSAEALADDLHRFLCGQSIQARPVPVWQQLWRSVRHRPAVVVRVLSAVALLCLLMSTWFYFQAADQRASRRATEKYQQFVQRRDEAFFYGLIARDEGRFFLGAEPAVLWKKAESAARQALVLAGMDPESGTVTLTLDFPAPQKSEIATDCYALLLLLAGDGEQQLELGEDRDKQCQEALQILDQAGRFGFQTRAYHLRRAYFLEQMGKQEEARQDKDQATSLPAESALDHFLVGEELYRHGDWEQAMNSFNRALNLHPSHFWARFFLAVCHLKMQRWEVAKADLNACLIQQPDFVWAYLFRSFANEKLQALTEAEADFQRALQLNPNEDARYVLFLTRGILHFNRRELEHAAADFRSAIALKPEQYNAYLNLAQVYLAQKQFEEAARQARAALRFQPPLQIVAGYHAERGRSLLLDQKYEESLQACTAALKLCPNQPLPYAVRGRALLALGHYESAERSFDQYLQSGGETVSDVFRGRGLTRMKLGKYPEAVEDYTRALELAPDGDIYQHRGWAHFFADAWKLALRDFSKAIELAPETGDAYTGRGLARVMLGHYREAVTDAETALHRQPGTPEMMHNIACVFAQAVACAEADKQVENRQTLADHYRNCALETVRRTLQMLRPEDRSSFWQDKILPDAALAPIHNNAEFKRLQNGYGPNK